ncbi:MAG: alpha/beta hydrolase [Chitinophagaceae bacterium]
MRIRENTLSINEQPLFYRITGQGRTVILVHGFGEDGTVWHEQAQFLGKDFQLIIPDLPGSGQSALASDVSMECMAETLKLLLDELEITSCVMIGHSMGGYVTLAFAEKYPEMLEAFGLFHSTAYADSEEKKVNRRRSITFIRQHGSDKFMEQSIPNLFSNEFKQEHPAAISNMIDQYRNFLPDALVAYYEAMIERPDRVAVLTSFPRPILFVMGASDTAVPIQQGLQQCYLPHISQVEILKNSGHMGMMEETGTANQLLHNFCHLVTE